MRILDRYVLGSFGKFFAICLSLFVSIFIIVDLFDRLDDFLSKNVALGSILVFYVSYFPVIFVNVVAPAALVSSLYVISTMNKNNEITALKSGGVSVYRLMLPFLGCGLLLWGAVYFTNEYFVPQANASWHYMTKYEFQTAEKRKNRKIVNHGFSDLKGKLYFFEELVPYSGQVRNVTVLTEGPGESVLEKVVAKEGVWQQYRLTLKDVTIVKYQGDNLLPQSVPELQIILEQPRDYYLRVGALSDYMSREQLDLYIHSISKIKRRLVPELMVDLYAKTALPFSSFLILMLGILSAFQNPHKGGALISVGLSAVVFTAFYLLMSLSIASGKGGLLEPAAAAWLPNIVLMLGSVVLFCRVKT